MDTRWTKVLVIVTGAAAVACGSRSGLPSDAATSLGGAGGSGGAPAGGTGGSPPSCATLVPREPVLTVESEPDQQFDDVLRFTDSSSDGKLVTGVFVRQLLGSQSMTVRHASLSAWQSWPTSPTLGPVYTTPFELSDELYPARSSQGTFALAAGLAEGPVFVDHLVPNAPGPGAIPVQPLTGISPMFLAAGSDPAWHFAGTYDGIGIIGHVIGPSVVDTPVLCCSSVQPVRAGAAPDANGWVVAVSSGATFGTCGDPAVTPGLPRRLDILHVGFDGSVSFYGGIDVVATIIDLQVAPRADGMYVVFSVSSAKGVPAIRAVRVAQGSIAVGPSDVSPSNPSFLSFTAAAMGSRLAVARRGDTGQILVSAHDESLKAIAQGALTPEGPAVGPTSAFGSPDGKSVLVAWTNEGPTPWHVQMARFDCSP